MASKWKDQQIEGARDALERLEDMCIKDDPQEAARLARVVMSHADALHDSAQDALTNKRIDHSQVGTGGHDE